MKPILPKSRLTRIARLVLFFTLAMVLGNFDQIIYRFTLPTDDCAGFTFEVIDPVWIFSSNLVGALSQQEPGDILVIRQ